MAGWEKEQRSFPTLLCQARARDNLGTGREVHLAGMRRSIQTAFSLLGSRENEYILTLNMEFNL